MTLTSSAFADGGQIPVKYSQAGDEVSPPLAWTGAPDSTASFVLIVHDANAVAGNGLDDVLHWMVWNIPGYGARPTGGRAAGSATARRHSPDQRDGPELSRTGGAVERSGPPLRVRALRAGHDARCSRRRRGARRDARRSDRGDGGTRPRKGGHGRPVQTRCAMKPRNHRGRARGDRGEDRHRRANGAHAPRVPLRTTHE